MRGQRIRVARGVDAGVLVLDGNLPNGDSLEVTTFLKERLAVRILFVPATMLGPLGATS
jgi:hypothetical protein